MDELNPLQGLLELRLGLGEVGLHRQSALLQEVLERHLLPVAKDEPSLPQVAGAGPHQLTGRPQPVGRSSRRSIMRRSDHYQLLRRWDGRGLHPSTYLAEAGDLRYLDPVAHRWIICLRPGRITSRHL